MNERWVCKRCFADNEEGGAACARCGLARGAEATDVDQTAWAAQTGRVVVAEQPLWRKLIGFWWIPVVGVALLIGYLQTAQRGDDGALTTAGTVDVQELQVGDCFDSEEEEEIAEVDGIPCTEPHTFEVFAEGTYGGAGDPYLTDAEWDIAFTAVCEREFEPYVGAPWAISEIFASMLTPSAESWEEGDREVTCVLFDPKGESLTEYEALTTSLRGAAR